VEIFRAEGLGWPAYITGLVVQLAFLVTFVALTVRLWPAGIAVVGFSSISNRELGLATVSTLTAVGTAAVFFSICLELVSFSRTARNAG
jgi:hypothetical protein